MAFDHQFAVGAVTELAGHHQEIAGPHVRHVIGGWAGGGGRAMPLFVSVCSTVPAMAVLRVTCRRSWDTFPARRVVAAGPGLYLALILHLSVWDHRPARATPPQETPSMTLFAPGKWFAALLLAVALAAPAAAAPAAPVAVPAPATTKYSWRRTGRSTISSCSSRAAPAASTPWPAASSTIFPAMPARATRWTSARCPDMESGRGPQRGQRHALADLGGRQGAARSASTP